MKPLIWFRRILLPLVLIGLMLAIFYRQSPAILVYPNRDPSVYIYAGQQLLKGALPYRDFWDHRPPGLFYLNAAGLIVGGGSNWGVWALEALCFCGAVVLSYDLLRRVFSAKAAFLATFAWIISLPLLYQFDLSEEFALLFQFAALYCFVRAETRGRYGAYGFALGATLALSMNLRPNLIGVWVGIVLFLIARAVLTRDLLKTVRVLLWMGVGWLAIMAPIVLYFAAIGQLGEMWNAAYTFNFFYANASFGYRLDTLEMGIGLLAQSGILFTGLGGWLLGLYLTGRRSLAPPVNALIALGLLLLPIELILSSLSGRLYPHYFISTLPVIAVLSGLLLHRALPTAQPAPFWELRWMPTALLSAGLMLIASINPLNEIMKPPLPVSTEQGLPARVASFLDRNTQPTDYVLVWGATASIYTASERTGSSRYVNNYTLFMPGFSTPDLIQAYIDELIRRPPAYIIDTALTDGRFSPLDPQGRQNWVAQKARDTRQLAELEDFAPVPAMSLLFSYIDLNFHQIGKAGAWVVYQRNDFRPPTGDRLP